MLIDSDLRENEQLFCKFYYFVLQSTKNNLYLCIEKYFAR